MVPVWASQFGRCQGRYACPQSRDGAARKPARAEPPQHEARRQGVHKTQKQCMYPGRAAHRRVAPEKPRRGGVARLSEELRAACEGARARVLCKAENDFSCFLVLMAVARALPHTHRAAHQKCGAHLWGFCASGGGSSGSARQCAVHSRGLQSYRRVRTGSGGAPRVTRGVCARAEVSRAESGCCGLCSLLRSASAA